jgi:hypothetical protein
MSRVINNITVEVDNIIAKIEAASIKIEAAGISITKTKRSSGLQSSPLSLDPCSKQSEASDD